MPRPILLGIVGDSAAGKTTLTRLVRHSYHWLRRPVVIVPFFGTTFAMQTVGVDLSAETKHTWTVPRCAPNCAGLHRGLGIRHKEVR